MATTTTDRERVTYKALQEPTMCAAFQVTANEQPDRILVKGPVQPQNVASAARPAETKKSPGQDDEPKGALESIRDNIDSIGKALNPFRW
jgi:hypothetical protein